MNNDLQDCYAILDLKPGVPLEKVKDAYRELVRVWHPDRFAHDPALQQKAQEKLKLINLAYEKICQVNVEEYDNVASGKAVSFSSNKSIQPCESTAPQPSQGNPPSYLLVLFAGLATTALTLFGVHWINVNYPDITVMGYYVEFIIPVGAIGVGIVAALGYGIVSWASGIKIVRGVCWAVIFFQVCAYCGAQYLEYKHAMTQYPQLHWSFFEYFDRVTRLFVWKSTDSTGEGTHLGVWGYGCRALELIGFTLGGLIVPAVLMKKPYCDKCRRYMKYRSLGLVPGSAPEKKVKKADTAGQAAAKAEQEAALASAQGLLGMLRQMAAEGRADDFQNAVKPLKIGNKASLKLPVRYRLGMSSCGKCAAGSLRIWEVTGRGKQIKQTELPRTDASPEFVTGISAKK